MEAAKFVVTPETKQIEFEAALLAHEDDVCAEYERKAALAKEQEEKEKEKDAHDYDKDKKTTSANGKDADADDKDRSRREKDRDRRDRRSRSHSRSRSRSRARGDGSRRRREKKPDKVLEAPPKRGFQEILDKRPVNLGIVFDALVEKAVVKRKEEVRIGSVFSCGLKLNFSFLGWGG